MASIARVSASLVAVGSVRPGARQESSPVPARFLGSGFSIGEGNRVVTSLHVVDQDIPVSERLAVFSGTGRRMEMRSAVIEHRDELHDLVVLRIERAIIPALRLADAEWVPVGTSVAFSGFPLGVNTGIYPVTHRAMISAVTPLASPVGRSESLSAAHLRAQREGFMVYQLDGMVLAGHSGSPVYNTLSGDVVGVAMGSIKIAQEASGVPRASGIGYVIPVKYLHGLLAEAEE